MALERQVQSLADLAFTADSDPGKRGTILETFPGLLECAINESHKAVAPPEVPAAPPVAPAPSAPPPAAPVVQDQSTAKPTALQHLVDEFFKQTDQHLKNGDYESASREIKRIFIIDPENSKAKAYEQTISKFMAARTAAQAKIVPLQIQKTPSPRKPEPPPREKTPSPRKPEPPPRDEVEFVPVQKTVEPPPTLMEIPEEPEPAPASKHVAQPQASPTGAKKKSAMFLPAAAVLGVGILGLVVYLVMFNGSPKTATATPAQEVQPTGQENASATQPTRQEPEVTTQNTGLDEPSPVPRVALNQPATNQAAPERSAATPSVEKKIENATAQSPKITDRASERKIDKPVAETRPQPEPEKRVETPVSQPVAAAAQPQKVAALSPEPLEKKEDAPSDFIPVEKMPRVVHLVQPKFSEIVYRSGTSGEVVIRVQIDQTGKPVQAKILKSTNNLLDSAVIEAVMQSEYEPGEMTGGPVTAWLTIPFKFKGR